MVYKLDNELEDNPPSETFQINRLVLWLAFIALGICFLPLLLIATTLRTTQQTMSTAIADIEETLALPPLAPANELSLSATLVASQTTLKQLGEVQATLVAEQMNWSAIMGVIGAFDPTNVLLSNFERNQRQITLVGYGKAEVNVMFYVDLLRASALFDRVTVQSLLTTNTTNGTTQDDLASADGFSVSFSLALSVKATNR